MPIAKGLIERFCRPAWAITPDALDAMMAQLPGDNLLSRIDGAGGRHGYEVRDGVAVVKIRGALVKEEDFWSAFYGESTYEGLRQTMQAALQDRSARAVLLDIDSPGGTVDGALELADFMHAAARVKPLYAFANGQMTSAALMISCSAKEIAAPRTAYVGSIGVISVHVDWSGFDEKMGVKVTYLSAGNDSEPLSDEARDYIQERLDQTYSIFVDTVARGRGMSTEAVLKMADGKIFLAEPAVAAGMIDRIETDLSAFISYIIEKEEIAMDLNELKEKHPDVYAAAMGEGYAKAEAEFNGQKTEMQRQVDQANQANADLATKVKDLERKDAIREERERKAAMKAVADGIFSELLAKSTVPVHLHGKIRAYVDPEKFCSAESGEFDAEAFKAAVEGEVQEWSVEGSTSSVAGGGYSGRAENDEDAVVSGLLKLVGQEG
jgi:signal peptide peptidase SppA